MITYVNSVFVSNTGALVKDFPIAPVQKMSDVSADKGKFIIYNCDANAQSDPLTITADTQAIKIGMVQGKNTVVRKRDGSVEYQPMIKWSNIIKKHDIKSFHETRHPEDGDTEDTVTIDFTNLDEGIRDILAEGRKRIIVRLTFKDLPTRYRKWTESYEYVTPRVIDLDATQNNAFDLESAIAQGIANEINGQWKRARVQATATGKKVVIEALPYDDDDAVDTLNWANKVRFNVSMWFTDPQAPGFASKNKYALKGATIKKEPGMTYAASAKLVRDREAQAMGYDGILNRGEGTWPIIKPEMNTELGGQYDSLTLEFENMYRAADDIFRKTKQTVEIYINGNTNGLKAKLAPFAGAPVNEDIKGPEEAEGQEQG